MHLIKNVGAVVGFDEKAWHAGDMTRAAPQHNSSNGDAGTRTISSVAVIVPCFNVESCCEPLIGQVAATGAGVFVIDDGSTDSTAAAVRRASLHGDVRVMRFRRNRGKGTALLAGLSGAFAAGYEYFVTIDADGQHRACDIERLVEACRSGADMAIGQRSTQAMPPKRRLANEFITAAVRVVYPTAPSDTQSGLRAYRRGVVSTLLRNVSGGRYETELWMLLAVLRERYRLALVPIPTIYFDGPGRSHFRAIRDSIRICVALWRFCRPVGRSRSAVRALWVGLRSRSRRRPDVADARSRV